MKLNSKTIQTLKGRFILVVDAPEWSDLYIASSAYVPELAPDPLIVIPGDKYSRVRFWRGYLQDGILVTIDIRLESSSGWRQCSIEEEGILYGRKLPQDVELALDADNLIDNLLESPEFTNRPTWRKV